MFRALIESTVLYPSDAVSAERLTEAAAHAHGIVYIRTTRPKTPVIYPNTEEFPVGGSKVVHQSDKDAVTVIAAGITLHEALKAADALAAEGISARVVDAYSVKPIDAATLREAARDCGGRLHGAGRAGRRRQQIRGLCCHGGSAADPRQRDAGPAPLTCLDQWAGRWFKKSSFQSLAERLQAENLRQHLIRMFA